VVPGLLPGLAGWGSGMLKAGLRVTAAGAAERHFGPWMLAPLQQADVWAAGAFALEQEVIVTAMLLAAMLVDVIECRLLAAAVAACAAVLAWFGVVHGW